MSDKPPGGAPPAGNPTQYLQALLAQAAYNPDAAAMLSQLLAQHRGLPYMAPGQFGQFVAPHLQGMPQPFSYASAPLGPGSAAVGAHIADQPVYEPAVAQHDGQRHGHQGRSHPAHQQRKRKRRSEADQEAAGAPNQDPGDGAEEAESEEGSSGTGSDAHMDLAPAMDRRAAALELLQRAGAPQDRAAKALVETEEQCKDTDAAGWADEAQVWLACNAEFEDERDQLAEAMQASLVEAEERKAQQAPLEERSPEEIAQDFGDSPLLCVLLPLWALPSLLEPPLRQPLLRYLQLEKRCRKWYALSRHFFRHCAAECTSQLVAAGQLPSSAATARQGGGGAAAAGAGDVASSAAEARPAAVTEEGGAGPGEGKSARPSRRSSRHCSPAVGEQPDGPNGAVAPPDSGGSASRRPTRSSRRPHQAAQPAEASGSSAAASQPACADPVGQEEGGGTAAPVGDPPRVQGARAGQASLLPVPEAAAQLVAALLSSRCEVVERQVYAMPVGDGLAVPNVFLAAAEGGKEEECVELLDE